MSEDEGGRVFFSNTGRTLAEEDEIRVLSVGIDIGSSTSHLVFSRLVLERQDSRYVVTLRETFFESGILLTPYVDGEDIDSAALGEFLRAQYDLAEIDPDKIDTGALILTGVAVRRRNARAIGDLFSKLTGKLVAVSAGDSLETIMAAYGSGAVARSIRERAAVMNVDIGGGTSKIAVCANGKVVDQTAVDVGARLVCLDDQRRVIRMEEAGKHFAKSLGIPLAMGATLSEDDARKMAASMAEKLFDAMRAKPAEISGVNLARIDPLTWRGGIDNVSFSGGVSEYIYGREATSYGDLGPLLADEVKKRVATWKGVALAEPAAGIRATVIGASQYTIQLSGSTIFVHPMETLPLRNVSVIAPELPLDDEKIDRAAVAKAVSTMLKRLDLAAGDVPVAVFVPWRGSATFHRLDDLCRGLADGLASVLAKGHPMVLAGDSDIGGLIGIHCKEELKLANPVVSIDGLELKEFDFIDIGAILSSSGAAPVVIKSLIFPNSAAIGKVETAPAG